MARSEKAIENIAQGLFDRIIVGGDGYQAAREDVKEAWRGYARFALDAAAAVGGNAQREALAQFMIKHSFPTGHGDTHAGLLAELDAAIQESVATRSGMRRYGI